MSHILEDCIRFLQASPTSWHASLEMSNRFASHDFIPLREEDNWQLQPGKSYFVIRGGSLCAFTVPKEKLQQAILLSSHTDSPALKIKPRPEIAKNHMVSFETEVYGGPILHSWLNRDLGIAGKIVYTNQDNIIEEKLVHIDDAPLFIPELAIHLEKDKNEKGFIVNKQDHLCPIATLEPDTDKQKNYLESLLRRHVFFNDLLAFDLFLVPLEGPRKLGIQGEMLASYRLDNLISAHACMAGMIFSKSIDPHLLQLAVFCDSEEIGSNTRDAAAPFLSDLLKRIHLLLGGSEEEFFQLKKRSLAVSVDVAHAFNPAFPDKYDPNHQPFLGQGVVIKSNANQKYASEATASSLVIHLCKKLNLPYQKYVNRSDLPGGSTLGPIIAEALGIKTVDIGIAQLSMHSIREVIACQDHIDMCQLLTHVLQEGPNEYSFF